MSDPVLRVFVERVVRPVRADELSKLKMREELLAHLSSAYEAELAAVGDEVEASQRAIERMGDADRLTAELQQTVTFLSRYGYGFDQLIRKRKGEPSITHALRLSLVGILALLPAWMLAILVSDWDSDHWWPKTTYLLPFAATITTGYACGLFVFSLVCNPVERLTARGFSMRRDWLRAVGLALVVVLVATLIGGSMTYALSFELELSLREGMRWAALGSLAAPLLFVCVWLNLRERRDLQPWLELEIVE